ncbi:MAG: hypothetical protein ACHRHE_11765 [Tepidisphaerales bacterium]
MATQAGNFQFQPYAGIAVGQRDGLGTDGSPRGNAVVFTFAWDSAKGRFSDLGYTGSWNNNDWDSRRLYVLRDLTPGDDKDYNYRLEFPSGINHEFSGSGDSYGPLEKGHAIGTLAAVDDNTGNNVVLSSLCNTEYGNYAAGMSRPALTAAMSGPSDTVGNRVARYAQDTVDVRWHDGRLDQLRYTYTDSGIGIEPIQCQLTTKPAYADVNALNPAVITALPKTKSPGSEKGSKSILRLVSYPVALRPNAATPSAASASVTASQLLTALAARPPHAAIRCLASAAARAPVGSSPRSRPRPTGPAAPGTRGPESTAGRQTPPPAPVPSPPLARCRRRARSS